MSYGNVIIDLEGYALTPEESELIRHPAVAGIILFTRNYHDKEQLKALTHSLKKARPRFIISVDQEGGRVQRFRPGFTILPPMAEWGELYQQDQQAALKGLAAMVELQIKELHEVGVNLNWAPVLDVEQGISQIIGNRSFSSDAEIVVSLAKIFIDTCHHFHMPVTGKHFPGHGGVAADSHVELPVDARSWQEIQTKDLVPFKALAASLDAIMPAHVVYSSVDAQPAGFSKHWLQTVLRQQLGFEGVIVSDDLTMAGAAIAGSYGDRAQLALEAGCDLLPVCNNRAGAIEVVNSVATYENSASKERLAVFIEKLP